MATSIFAKSVIMDIASLWGSDIISFRQLRFYKDGVMLPLTDADYTAYATSYYSSFTPNLSFDTTKSVTGSEAGQCWHSTYPVSGSQRIQIVVNTAIEFDAVGIINGHDSGAETTDGVKDIKLYVSTDSITSTVYDEAIANSTIIFDGEIPEHSAIDEADEYTIPLRILPDNLWEPTDGTGDLWYDGKDESTVTESGGLVSGWADKIGNIGDATATGSEPDYIDEQMSMGATDYFLIPNNFDSDTINWFMVARSNSSATQGVIDAKGGTATSTDDGGFYFLTSGTATTGSFWTVSNGSTDDNITTGSDTVFRNQDTPVVIQLSYNSTTGVASIYFNGNLVKTETLATGLLSKSTSITEVMLGKRHQDTSGFIGGIFDVVAYDGPITQEEADKVIGYLAWYRGLEGSLPVDFPYKDSPPLTSFDPALVPDANKSYYMVDNSAISSDLTDFPLKIKLDRTTTTGAAFLDAVSPAAGVSNLSFYIGEGVAQYPVEVIELTNDVAFFNTKLPLFAATGSVIVTIGFDTLQSDNSLYVGVTGSTPAKAVWSNGVHASINLGQDPTGTILDSSTNGHNAVAGGSGTLTASDSDYGKGITFDGDSYLTLGNAFEFVNTATITVFAKPTTLGDTDGLVSKRTSTESAGNWALRIGSGDSLEWVVWTSSTLNQNIESTGDIVIDAYTVLTMSYADTTPLTDLYLDGDLDTSSSAVTYPFVANTEEIRIGFDGQTGYLFGDVIEVRLDSVVRSADWIKATELSLYGQLLTEYTPGGVLVSFLESRYGVGIMELVNYIFKFYGDYNFFRTYLDTIYALKNGTHIEILYGDAGSLKAALNMYYNDSKALKRALTMEYGDVQALINAIEMRYSSTESHIAVLESLFDIYGTKNNAVLEALYNIKDVDGLKSVLSSIYTIEPDGGLLLQGGSLTIADESIPFTYMELEATVDRYIIVVDAIIADPVKWKKIKHLDHCVANIGGIDFELVVFGKGESSSFQSKSYSIEAGSPALQLAFPYAAAVETGFVVTMASDTCRRLAALEGITLTEWNLADGLLNASEVQLAEMSPIEAIKYIVGEIGGQVQSTPEGDIIVNRWKKVNSDKINSAEADHTVSNFITTTTTDVKKDGYNKFFVSETSVVSDNYTIEVEEISTSESLVKVYQYPWVDEEVELWTSEVVNIVGIDRQPDVDDEYNCDPIEIVEGAGNVSRGVYTLIDYDYGTSTDLGVVSPDESGNITTATYGESTVDIKYYSRYRSWIVRHTGVLTAQFILSTVDEV